MSFLDAPYVQRSIEEAEFLKARLLNQTEIVLNTKGEDLQVALDYFHTLYALVEKEHMLIRSLHALRRHGRPHCGI